MGRTWWLRFSLVLLLTIAAGAFVTPTVFNLNPETSKFPIKTRVTLGLDLQGGLYMVFGVDLKKVFSDLLTRQMATIGEQLKKDNVGVQGALDETKAPTPDDPRGVLKFEAGQKDKVKAYITEHFPDTTVFGETDSTLEIGFSWNHRNEVRDKTMGQSIQVVRNRIDEFGIAEPGITTQGNDRIVVELPGVRDVERAKSLVGQTARLEFKMVDDENMQKLDLAALIAQAEKDKGIQYKEGQRFSDYVTALNTALKGKIPEGRELLFERTQAPGGAEVRRVPFLLFSKVEVTGEELRDANIGYDEWGNPHVGFVLNPQGASVFADLSGKNIGRRMAIILDSIIHSAPVFQGKIPDGRGQITMGRQNLEDTMKEAKDLAIVLRAGALPAGLELLEQRVIGPSLGQDSIKNGVWAGLLGCLLIFVFMVVYYRVSGAIAVVSLILNLLFSLAILIVIGATLTLPGIAGLALVIGMGVDSNVIILERIRDEIHEGSSLKSAIEKGFDRAFRAIFDANITHGIVGVILMNFGTGPLKGFAITLIIGIVTTLFCAVTVAKLMFDYYTNLKPKTLSI